MTTCLQLCSTASWHLLPSHLAVPAISTQRYATCPLVPIMLFVEHVALQSTRVQVLNWVPTTRLLRKVKAIASRGNLCGFCSCLAWLYNIPPRSVQLADCMVVLSSLPCCVCWPVTWAVSLHERVCASSPRALNLCSHPQVAAVEYAAVVVAIVCFGYFCCLLRGLSNLLAQVPAWQCSAVLTPSSTCSVGMAGSHLGEQPFVTS